ncbi:MAG: DMT family transporter [Alphaproteobacteria bacterium]|nr:DMT family transporter [Alphaproteobacteria bacterium]
MHNAFPYLVAFLAVTFYACLPVIAKKMNADIPPFAFIALTMLGLSLCGFFSSIAFEKSFVFSELQIDIYLWILLFAILNFFGFFLSLYAISQIPLVKYQMINMILPVITGILAFLILLEPFKARYLIGIVFIAIGIFIALSDSSAETSKCAAPLQDNCDIVAPENKK